MRIGRAAVLLWLAFALAACTTDGGVRRTYDGPQYSCCLASDIERTYYPGDTISLRWNVTPAQDPRNTSPNQFELTAMIVGPFSTAADLKSDVTNGSTPGALTVSAVPVHPTGSPGEQPVSTMVIPTTAVPGYYNLAWSVTDTGGTVSAGSVIQVVARL